MGWKKTTKTLLALSVFRLIKNIPSSSPMLVLKPPLCIYIKTPHTSWPLSIVHLSPINHCSVLSWLWQAVRSLVCPRISPPLQHSCKLVCVKAHSLWQKYLSTRTESAFSTMDSSTAAVACWVPMARFSTNDSAQRQLLCCLTVLQFSMLCGYTKDFVAFADKLGDNPALNTMHNQMGIYSMMLECVPS